MSNADELVAKYILGVYREENPRKHLAECPKVIIEHPEAEDGYYGCETGCEYYSLEATFRCPHGESEEFHYGDFGQISYILEDLEKEAIRQAQQPSEPGPRPEENR